MLPPMLRIPILLLGLVATAASQGFVDVTGSSGLSMPAISDPMGRGFACADFTGDLLPDVIVWPAPGAPPQLWINQGNGTFTDLGPGSGLTPSLAFVRTLAPADFDGDGDQDLYVCLQLEPDRLYVNDGTGGFTEEAAQRGITHGPQSFSASFGDYDRDGHLDLYVGRAAAAASEASNILYRSDGAGGFLDVTAASGTGDTGLALTVAFCDADEDGWPDLHVINDKGYAVSPNALLRNMGDGTFVDFAPAWGLDLAVDSMGVDFIDLFADGGQDFYVADNPPDHHLLVHDPATSTWVENAGPLGLAGGHVGWCPLFLDYDCDGWADVFVAHSDGPNGLYAHPGPSPAGTPFIDVAASLGADLPYREYSTAVLDFDADGRPDLLHLLNHGPFAPPGGLLLQRNQVTTGAHLRLRLQGTRSNRDGLGALVRVSANGVVQRQWHRSGRGYLAASEPVLHFGLGGATQADVSIRWPSGQEQLLPGVSANQTIDVVEPELRLSAPPTIGSTTQLVALAPNDAGLPIFYGLALTTSPGIPLPDGRLFALAFDPVLALSLAGQNPLLPSFGNLDGAGFSAAPLTIPALPQLSGAQAFAAAAVFDAQAPSGVRNLLDPLRLVIP